MRSAGVVAMGRCQKTNRFRSIARTARGDCGICTTRFFTASFGLVGGAFLFRDPLRQRCVSNQVQEVCTIRKQIQLRGAVHDRLPDEAKRELEETSIDDEDRARKWGVQAPVILSSMHAGGKAGTLTVTVRQKRLGTGLLRNLLAGRRKFVRSNRS